MRHRSRALNQTKGRERGRQPDSCGTSTTANHSGPSDGRPTLDGTPASARGSLASSTSSPSTRPDEQADAGSMRDEWREGHRCEAVVAALASGASVVVLVLWGGS